VSVAADAKGTLINRVSVGGAEPDAIPGDNDGQASVRVRSHGFVYMPLVLKVWPPLPGKPDLFLIDNVDQDGNYTISWAAAATGPETTAYDLEENGEIIVADYVFTSCAVLDRGPGTYSYRVRGKNSHGFGRWSDSKSAVVVSSVFKASADAHVLQGRADTNLGAVTSMWVGYDDSLDPDGKIARSFVQFDLSEIAASTPISEAILYLRLYNVYDFEGQSRLITVYRTDSPWSELDVTWDLRPSIDEAFDAVSVEYEGVDQWYAFDITDLVRGWVGGSWPNYGLAILGPEHSGIDSSWRSFYTRETSSDPYIYVTFSTGSVD